MIRLHREHRVPGKRLGRHVHHDPKSRGFDSPFSAKPLISASWERHCPPYDQGDLGSCTGNAMAGALMTGPLWRPGRMLTEDDALQIYEAATHLDRIPGAYPPDDTGSTGLAVAHAAKLAGLINIYHHAFSVHAALASLGRGPVILGIDWYEGFDTPVGTSAELQISGSVRGGHEVCLVAIDVDTKMVRGCNSWGADWGDGGFFSMSFDTLTRLLASDGDCTVFT
jgi:hypothetical protein